LGCQPSSPVVIHVERMQVHQVEFPDIGLQRTAQWETGFLEARRMHGKIGDHNTARVKRDAEGNIKIVRAIEIGGIDRDIMAATYHRRRHIHTRFGRTARLRGKA